MNTGTNDKVIAKVVCITPELAAKWLKEANKGNRPIRQSKVNEYAKALKEGKWKLNGQTITVSNDRLIDGQHRLAAIVKSGVDMITLAVVGVENDVFNTIDIGAKRSSADFLSCLGEAQSKILASALLYLEAYYSKNLSLIVGNSLGGNVVDMLEKYPNARNHLISRRAYAYAPAGMLSACKYIFDSISPKDCQEFFDRLLTGANLAAYDPVLVLRDKLAKNASDIKKLPREHVFALIIKSWNMHRNGAPCVVLRYRTNGDAPESFPVAI
jgi:hypothetical protein